MKNSSSAVMIFGAALCAILAISLGMVVYNSASATIDDSMNSMSVQEIEAFNSQFDAYEGTQTGSNVKTLISRLSANAGIYENEEDKIPTVVINDEDEIESNDIDEYIQRLEEHKDSINVRSNYEVEMNYSTSGLINKIIITK